MLYEYLEFGKVPDYVDWEVKDEHITILKMFIINGMSATEIAETGAIISKRGKPMSSDMVSLWLRRYLPFMEYERGKFHCKRGKDKEAQKEFARMKKIVPKTPCVLCGSTEDLQLDHIKAWFFGGKTEPSNMQWLCYNCHRKKTAEEFEWL